VYACNKDNLFLYPLTQSRQLNKETATQVFVAETLPCSIRVEWKHFFFNNSSKILTNNLKLPKILKFVSYFSRWIGNRPSSRERYP